MLFIMSMSLGLELKNFLVYTRTLQVADHSIFLHVVHTKVPLPAPHTHTPSLEGRGVHRGSVTRGSHPLLTPQGLHRVIAHASLERLSAAHQQTSPEGD